MTLSKRERTLSIAAGIPLVLLVLWYGYKLAFAGGSSGIGARIDAARKDLDAKQTTLDGLQRNVQPMDDIRKRALPMDNKDAEQARTLYKSWLAKLAERSGFERPQLTLGQVSAPRNAGYAKLPYTLRARGSLSQVTRFLHGFYSAGHLHIIRTMTLKPADRSTNLDAMFQIEALAMTEADRKDALSTAPGRKLDLSDLSEYRKKIEDRDFFANVKPKPPAKETPKPVDPSRYAFVTGIVRVDGRSKVCLKARTTDESFELAEGETFRIGNYRGKIAKIGAEDVDIEADKKVTTVALGDPIRGKVETEESSDGPPGFAAGFGFSAPPSGNSNAGGPAAGPSGVASGGSTRGGPSGWGSRGGSSPFGAPPGGGTPSWGSPPGGGMPRWGAPPGGSFGGFSGFGGSRGSSNRDSAQRNDRPGDNAAASDADEREGRRSSRGYRTRGSERFRGKAPSGDRMSGAEGSGAENGRDAASPRSAGST